MNQRPAHPFLLRFGASLPDPGSLEIRYDADRQIAVVADGESWRPALDAGKDDPPQTMMTEVKRETTDDD
jgi:hypothetical protein